MKKMIKQTGYVYLFLICSQLVSTSVPVVKISLLPGFSNISLVVRVGANDNVKLIPVFTFKAASVS